MKRISRDGRDGSIKWNALRTKDGRRISAIVPRCGNPDGPKPLSKITGRSGSYAATRSWSRRASSRGHSSAPATLPGCESDLDTPAIDCVSSLVLLFVGNLAAQHTRDRLVNPRIDLQIAIFFRREPKFNRAITADKGLLPKARGIFDRNAQQPLGEFATAYHAVKFARM